MGAPMTTRARLVATAGLAAALAAVLIAERATEERANRLHRGGAWSTAAGIYRARLSEEIPSTSQAPDPDESGAATAPTAHLHYNLGTALLELDEPSDTRARLVRATASLDHDVRSLAYYNLGVASLSAAISSTRSDSALVHVLTAIDENRDALRLSPGREEAAWNLAFARRMLDSLDAAGRRAGVEAGQAFSDEEMMGDNTMAEGESGEIMAPPGMLGEEETAANLEADEILSLEEAEAILEGIRLDGEIITRKLLGYASRSLWGTRARTRGRRW